jgi:hypothetical protein
MKIARENLKIGRAKRMKKAVGSTDGERPYIERSGEFHKHCQG